VVKKHDLLDTFVLTTAFLSRQKIYFCFNEYHFEQFKMKLSKKWSPKNKYIWEQIKLKYVWTNYKMSKQLFDKTLGVSLVLTRNKNETSHLPTLYTHSSFSTSPLVPITISFIGIFLPDSATALDANCNKPPQQGTSIIITVSVLITEC